MIPDWIYDDKMKRKIAVKLAKANKFDEAIKIANMIKDANDRSSALWYIVEELAEVGEFNKAIKTAEMIEIAKYYSWALRDIAVKLARTGEIEKAKKLLNRAIEIAEKIEDYYSRSVTLQKITKELPKFSKKEWEYKKRKVVYIAKMCKIEKILMNRHLNILKKKFT